MWNYSKTNFTNAGYEMHSTKSHTGTIEHKKLLHKCGKIHEKQTSKYPQ